MAIDRTIATITNITTDTTITTATTITTTTTTTSSAEGSPVEDDVVEPCPLGLLHALVLLILYRDPFSLLCDITSCAMLWFSLKISLEECSSLCKA